MRGANSAARMAVMPRTLLIVDDHAGFRSSARALFEADGRLVVVGEAGTGTEAITAVHRLRPDIVLLDIALPDIDGFAVCESIMSGETVQPIVVLTSSRSTASYGSRLSASRARGFIPKDDLSAASLRSLTG
jgi:DNA-binding NarL/FixJ family response regulator